MMMRMEETKAVRVTRIEEIRGVVWKSHINCAIERELEGHVLGFCMCTEHLQESF